MAASADRWHVAGPLFLHRLWIAVTIAIVAVAMVAVMLRLPKTYRADAEISVRWLNTRVPAEPTARIVAAVIAAHAAAGRLVVVPELTPSFYRVVLASADSGRLVGELDTLLAGIATDRTDWTRRAAVTADLAKAERDVAELSSALALTQNMMALPPASPAPAVGDQATPDGQALAVASSAADAAKQAVLTATGARDAASADLAALQQRYGPLHPAIAQGRATLDAADVALQKATAQSVDLQSKLAAVHKRQRAAQIASGTAAAASANEIALLVAKLTATSAAAERRYATLLRVAGEMKPPPPYAVRIVRPATLSGSGNPSTLAIALAGLIAALSASGLVVLVLELRTKGFRTARAMAAALGRPVIALLPEAPGGPSRNPADLVLDAPESAIGVACRQALAAMDVTAAQPGRGVIAICSALPAEGKTTTTLSLARAAALSGVRTAVVDCDGRRGVLSTLLPGTGKAGLAQVLDGDASIVDALERDASGAFFLRHSADATIRDMSRSQPIRRVLDELRARFDLVLLDTAPVLALVETRDLAALADDVLFIARWRATPRDASRLAMKTLAKAGVTVGGIVATRVASRGRLVGVARGT